MEPKAGKLIKTVMPTFPEGVFDADSPILKDAMSTKATQVAEKFGKYGDLKAPPADLSSFLSFAGISGAMAGSMDSGISDIDSFNDAFAEQMPFTNSLEGIVSTETLDMEKIPLQARLGEALHEKALENLALQERIVADAVTTDKLAAVGIGTAQLRAISGMSPEQLGLTSSISSTQLATAGISPEKLAMSADFAAGITTDDSKQGMTLSPEQLDAIGIDKQQLVSMSGLSAAQLEVATNISTEQLVAAGVTDEKLSILAGVSATGPALSQPSPVQVTSREQLATGVSSEQVAAVSIESEKSADSIAAPMHMGASTLINPEQNANRTLSSAAIPTGINKELLTKDTGNSSSTGNPKHESQQTALAKSTFISIAINDEMGQPVCGQAFEITLKNGSTIKGSTDENGCVLIRGVNPEDCSLSLPNLHANAW